MKREKNVQKWKSNIRSEEEEFIWNSEIKYLNLIEVVNETYL